MGVVVVLLVVNITTESTSTNTIQVTSAPSTLIRSGPLSLRKPESMPLRIPPSLQSLTSLKEDSSRFSAKADSQLNQSLSRPDSSPDKLKKKSRPPVVFVYLSPKLNKIPKTK